MDAGWIDRGQVDECIYIYIYIYNGRMDGWMEGRWIEVVEMHGWIEYGGLDDLTI